MLELIWFVINILFVTLAIAFLFANRSLQDARRSGEAERIQKIRMWRNVTGLSAAAAFAGMAIAFMANMHVNG